ncbi:MAG TPA: ATP-binding protein [Dongiaceae bacterium]|nr:ATP-binding protein [Dongiaceae bacterium]
MTISSKAAIAAYLCSFMRSFAPDTKPGQRLAEWLRHNRDRLGFDLDAALRLPAPSVGQRIRLPERDVLLPLQWAAVSRALAASQDAAIPLGDPVAANITALATALDLDPPAADVFRFVVATERDKSFEWLCTQILSTRCLDTLGLIAAGIGSDPTTVWNALSTGPLGTLQLVKVAANAGDDLACFVPPRITQALMPPNQGLADIERHLIGRPLPPTLDAEDYGHIAAELRFVKRLLGNALARGTAGVNVLFHGIPGTGKTELCKTIAAELGVDLFGVGEVDDWGGEPDRSERLDALTLAARLAERRGNTLLLFDEMQDLLRSDDEHASYARRRRNVGSKVFMNRLLERNRVPILWASNDLHVFDPAFIRRMSYVLEMKPLPIKARTRMVAKTAERSGMALDHDQAAALARRYRGAPGIVSGAIASVQAAGGDAAEIVFAADALARAVEHVTPPAAAVSGPFNAALANADIDLAALERRMKQPSAPRDLSLFLYGPPGTGKSAFARHLAAAMDLEPMFRRASDLLSKWVGETEQRLAEAFTEAREDHRFLIIDEAEPFLWSRSSGSRSWEVSMVDEFLVQMESHPMPLACTSNLLEAVDSAALRRFTLKVKFDFLSRPQAENAYRHFFDRPAPAALGELTSLTPSDFAAVIKQCRFLGGDAIEDARLVALLEREVAAKNGAARRIGF